MRIIAILLIVNSHFNSRHITDFEPFGLYGYLGHFGDLIFFYISSYILTFGYPKYSEKPINWSVYRFTYLVFVVIVIKAVFWGVINRSFPNIFFIFLDVFNGLDFISVMIYLSVLFPVFLSIGKKARIIIMVALLVLTTTLKKSVPIDVLHLFSYSLAFFLGISVAKKELFKFESKKHIYILFFFSSLGYMLSKLYNIPDFVTVLSRLVLIYSLLEILSAMNFQVLPDISKSFIEIFAKLSLYIYLTHLYFIEISYEMNKYFGVIIILVMIFPICYIEYKIIEPVLKKLKKIII